MADIYVPINDATAVTRFSSNVFAHAISTCKAAQFMAVNLKSASDKTNIVQLFDELKSGPGDQVKYDLIPNIVGPGVVSPGVIAGAKVGWNAFQDTLSINKHRQAQKLKGTMSQQRVPYSIRKQMHIGIGNWYKEIFDCGMLNQLGGNTYQSNVAYTGLNTVTATDTAHWSYAGAQSAESGLTSSHPMSLQYIPDLVAKAQSQLTFPIKPVMVGGVEVAGVLFLHPLQVRDMRKSFTAGEWGNIQLAALQGGQASGQNPMFTGAIGMYDNVLMHQDRRVPWGNTAQNVVYDPAIAANIAAPTALGVAASGTTSVARAIFCGAQALAMAFGGAAQNDAGDPMRVKWVEELLDAQDELRVTASMTYGIKKTMFNSQNYGCIVLSTWAAP